jgi:hypothetical protein
MDSKKSKVFGALLFLPLAVLLVGTSAANDDDADQKKRADVETPDLVITEDTQIALHGRNGKAVTGSCKYEDPLWEGKVALKNIGNRTIEVPEEEEEEEETRPLVPPIGGERELRKAEEALKEKERELRPPHVRVYVPNNIEFRADRRLTHDLSEYGQELLTIKIGEKKNKCRNYDAPPVFDERLSGVAGPLPAPAAAAAAPYDGYGWRIKRIQHALIQKGYPLTPDGDYGPETSRAVAAYFRDRRLPPPDGIHRKPISPETVSFLLEALAAGGESEEVETVTTGGVGGDECKRGVNLVPIYIEIDPERDIPNENRTNNRVQFTVAIDCSNVAR